METVFLPVSLLLFSLVALELSAIMKKSAEEGRFAFLSPLIRSSRVQMLNERLQELVKIKDTRNLRALLVEAGIIDGTEHSLKKLENLELSITRDFELHYNRILHYLPDDLKDFFEAYKILWDVENLKLLLCYTLSQKQIDGSLVRIAGPFGYLDSSSIRSLAESGNPKDLIERAMDLLPTEFSPEIDFKNGYSSNDLGFSLDVAAFKYLQQKSLEIGTKKARKAWNLVSGIYEVKNLVTMARLKYSGDSAEDIGRFLFPSHGKLSDALIERLLESEDYAAFLRTLRMSPYGEFIPVETVDPAKLEESLGDGLQRSESRDTPRDMTVENTARFLAELDVTYDMIRKAAFFSLTKDQYGR